MPPPSAELKLPAATGWATPAALCAVLAAALCVQLALPVAEPGPPAPQPRPLHAASRTVFDTEAPATEGGGEALARPPFSPSRSATELAAASESLGLLGIARVGSAALATVQDAGGATQTLRPGESFKGWRLAAAAGDRAVLVRGGEAHTLRVGERAVGAPATGPSSAIPPAGAPPPAMPSRPGGRRDT